MPRRRETMDMGLLDYLNIIVQGIWSVVGFILISIWGGILACIPATLQPRQDVKDKLVLITGGGMGLGRLLALKFAKAGSRLVLWDLNKDSMNETAELCRKLGVKVDCYECDVSNEHLVKGTAKRVQTEVGNVEILVNNAGIVYGSRFLDLSREKIEKVMGVNTLAHFWVTQAFLPHMLDSNSGHIVSVASAAGLFGGPFLTDYCTSKYAAIGFMESLQIELMRLSKDITLTTICPTYMDTTMFPEATMPLMPRMSPEYVADRAFDAILLKRRQLFLPRLVYFLFFLKGFIPSIGADFLARRLNVHVSMDGFLEAKQRSNQD